MQRKPERPQTRKPEKPETKTSWQPASQWYNSIVGEEGHYYHQAIILPGLQKLMKLKDTATPSVLDLACGQGVLGRQIASDIEVYGFDIAPSLIKAAAQYDRSHRHHYGVADATKPLPITKVDFSHAAIVLALQNIEHPDQVFVHVSKHLRKGGEFFIVLNHPCFRIPRQSSWKVDEENKNQYRRIDRYMSEMKIPIQTHPSKSEQSTTTYSFHHPLSAYTRWLNEAGFSISLIEEWCSDKASTGKNAKMENRCREEFPLFMTIVAKKL